MSATYNWAYKPGVTNKYGLVIAGEDGSVNTLNGTPVHYCALFGNDLTGNGSRLYPFRTLNRIPAASFAILGPGVYRESPSHGYRGIIGDGDVIIDGTLKTVNPLNVCLIEGGFSLAVNITFTGADSVAGTGGAQIHNVSDCNFLSCRPTVGSGAVAYYDSSPKNSISISNTAGSKNLYFSALAPRTYENSTYINHIIQIGDSNTDYSVGAISPTAINACIFENCKFSFYQGSAPTVFAYTLFHNCSFKFQGQTEYTVYTSIADVIAAAAAIYGMNDTYFKGCLIADPKFNNPEIGDFTLAFDSPAKNLSYFGTFVGARSIAQALRIRSVEANGDFDFSTAVNMTIADNSITLTDPSQDAVIETKTIQNILGRELRSIPAFGFNADRNGQYIDSIADLAGTTKAAGDTLVIPASYLVEAGAIFYNGTSIQAGGRFTTVSGQTTFSTATGGVVREILEAPQRHTIEMKVSDVQPFTTEAWQHYEAATKPMTNNVGDSRLGAILRGNGDPAYVRGSTVEFPVNSKYVKIKFTIRVKNLKP